MERGGWLYEAADNFIEPCRKFMDEIHSYGARVFMEVTAGQGRNLEDCAYIQQFVDIPVVAAGRMEDVEKSARAVNPCANQVGNLMTVVWGAWDIAMAI